MLGFEVEQLTGRSTSTSSPSPSHSPSTGNGSSPRNFSYTKLPEDTLNLSIRKLDGSSFDVDVSKLATVADLKLRVQNVFSHMPNDGPQKISWRMFGDTFACVIVFKSWLMLVIRWKSIGWELESGNGVEMETGSLDGQDLLHLGVRFFKFF